MAEDPHEAARRAFGDAGPPASVAPPGAVPGAPAPGPAPAAVVRAQPREAPTRRLAAWGTRAGAFLIDQLLLGAVAFVLAFVAAAVFDDRADAEVLAYAIVIPLGLLYAPLLMARAGERNGQSLGKQWLGIRVVRTDGEPVTFGTGVLRTVIGQQLLIMVTFYLYAFADYLWPLRDAQNQALHDKIAKTWVVQGAAPPPPEPPPPHSWLPPRAPGADG